MINLKDFIMYCNICNMSDSVLNLRVAGSSTYIHTYVHIYKHAYVHTYIHSDCICYSHVTAMLQPWLQSVPKHYKISYHYKEAIQLEPLCIDTGCVPGSILENAFIW